MIATSCHKNWKSDKYITVSISGNRGKDANYVGKCYPKLAPKLEFWKIWHDNIGKISEEENTKYYIEQYYIEVLSKVDPKEVYRELDNSVLLCYEDNIDFCHRHIVAAWLEILLGVTVPEQSAESYEIETKERPSYIKEYLEEIMCMNKNMRGFNSLRALYLFECGEKLEIEATKMEQATGKSFDCYRQNAAFLRCDADHIEEEYNRNKAQVLKLNNKE